jgi:hypothetical protein
VEVRSIARVGAFVSASFSGSFVEECEHVGRKHIRLINFESHGNRISTGARATANVLDMRDFGILQKTKMPLLQTIWT